MANRSLNKVMLIGNLTRDPELRYTPSGTAVCTFGLATNRQWTDPEGNIQESTEFHRIVAWGKLAELCSQLLFKGRKVYVEGRLQTREWTAPDGSKRTTTEVVIDSMLALDRKTREPITEEVAPVTQPEETPEEEKKQGGEKEEKKTKSSQEKKKTEKEEKSSSAKTSEEKEEVKAEDIPF